MAEEAIKISGKKKSAFIDKVKQLLPEGGNLNLCLTCGACSSMPAIISRWSKAVR